MKPSRNTISKPRLVARYAMLLLICLLLGPLLIVVYLGLLVQEKLRDMRERRMLRELKLKILASDFPDIPDEHAKGPLRELIPKKIRNRSRLMCHFIGLEFDLDRKARRCLMVDEVTGIGYYVFRQDPK